MDHGIFFFLFFSCVMFCQECCINISNSFCFHINLLLLFFLHFSTTFIGKQFYSKEIIKAGYKIHQRHAISKFTIMVCCSNISLCVCVNCFYDFLTVKPSQASCSVNKCKNLNFQCHHQSSKKK